MEDIDSRLCKNSLEYDAHGQIIKARDLPVNVVTGLSSRLDCLADE